LGGEEKRGEYDEINNVKKRIQKVSLKLRNQKVETLTGTFRDFEGVHDLSKEDGDVGGGGLRQKQGEKLATTHPGREGVGFV